MKVALVIGAYGNNLGGAIAHELNNHGYDVHVADARIRDGMADDHYHPLSVTDNEEFAMMLTEIGVIDLMVYSAGVNVMGSILDYNYINWESTMDANLNGLFVAIQEYANHCLIMRHEGHIMDKKIIAVTSNTAFIPRTRSVAYCVSKAGANMLVMQAHRELAPRGFKIMGFAPGVIEDTAMHKKTHEELFQLRGWDEDKCQEERKKLIPMGRFTNKWECAEVVAFLASPAGDYFGGEIVRYGGGEK